MICKPQSLSAQVFKSGCSFAKNEDNEKVDVDKDMRKCFFGDIIDKNIQERIEQKSETLNIRDDVIDCLVKEISTEVIKEIMKEVRAEAYKKVAEIISARKQAKRYAKKLEDKIAREAGQQGSASGLMWRKAGDTKPVHGRNLENSELAEALTRKIEFSQQEWDKFGIKDLCIDDFVKSGESYFTPAAQCMNCLQIDFKVFGSV